MINVFLVDDHELIREGLKKVLAQYPDIRVVGESGDAAGLFRELGRTHTDVLVLDISLPGRSGFEILQDVAVRFPKVRVLVLTMHPEERFAFRTLRAGAYGYITKEARGEEIVNAIRKIAGGRKYVTESLTQELLFELSDNRTELPHERLSDREYEVFLRLASGKSNQEIADDLSLSVNTVATYKSRVLEKLNLRTKVELTRYAMEHDLVD